MGEVLNILILDQIFIDFDVGSRLKLHVYGRTKSRKAVQSFDEGPDECRPAFKDSAGESVAPEFLACLANFDHEAPSDGSNTGGVDPLPPILDETVKTNCLNLEEKNLWTKKITKDKKAHAKHHDDYIGLCKQ
jgi:hypothetical protein